MMRSGLRYWFKSLLWLAGLAIIIVYSPAKYRALNLADGENIAGFLGKTHELMTVATAQRLSWSQLDLAATVHRMRCVDVHGYGPLPLGDRVYLRDLYHDTAA